MADQKKSLRRSYWLIAGAVVLSVFVFTGMLYWFAFLRGWTLEKTERLVRTDLPVGSTRLQAEVWLDGHGIKHSYLNDVSRNRLAGQTIPQRAGLSERDLGGMLEGFIADANVDPIYENQILVYFLFDREDRLVGHVIYPWVTDRSHLMQLLAPPPSTIPYAE